MRNVQNLGIPNFFKFLLLVIFLSPLIFYIAKRNHTAIEYFEADGEVIHIEWNSRDHGMPVISIKQENKVRLFKSNRITLNKKSIEIGDSFSKVSGSKECKINGRLINCIN